MQTKKKKYRDAPLKFLRIFDLEFYHRVYSRRPCIFFPLNFCYPYFQMSFSRVYIFRGFVFGYISLSTKKKKRQGTSWLVHKQRRVNFFMSNHAKLGGAWPISHFDRVLAGPAPVKSVFGSTAMPRLTFSNILCCPRCPPLHALDVLARPPPPPSFVHG